MTYSELISKATPDERKALADRIIKIIGTQEQAKETAQDLTERVQKATAWRKEYERLSKVFLEHDEKALAMNFVQKGRSFEGVTAGGKKWFLDANHGWTQRSRYCGTLYIEGIGTIFTSGRLDKAFEYILNN
jgi:hypothetical protein